jgi:hypothetical protein
MTGTMTGLDPYSEPLMTGMTGYSNLSEKNQSKSCGGEDLNPKEPTTSPTAEKKECLGEKSEKPPIPVIPVIENLDQADSNSFKHDGLEKQPVMVPSYPSYPINKGDEVMVENTKVEGVPELGMDDLKIGDRVTPLDQKHKRAGQIGTIKYFSAWDPAVCWDVDQRIDISPKGVVLKLVVESVNHPENTENHTKLEE